MPLIIPSLLLSSTRHSYSPILTTFLSVQNNLPRRMLLSIQKIASGIKPCVCRFLIVILEVVSKIFPLKYKLYTEGTMGEKVLKHCVFDLFSLTYMCVDIDFHSFSD